jgi:hypothetical protein
MVARHSELKPFIMATSFSPSVLRSSDFYSSEIDSIHNRMNMNRKYGSSDIQDKILDTQSNIYSACSMFLNGDSNQSYFINNYLSELLTLGCRDQVDRFLSTGSLTHKYLPEFR